MGGWSGFLFLLFLALSSCTKDSPTTVASGSGDARKGKAIYIANCAVCHHGDPSKDGALGPPVKGSSIELLEAKIMRASYPPGYDPKRKTSSMPAYPYLKSTIPDLVAFLR